MNYLIDKIREVPKGTNIPKKIIYNVTQNK